MAQLMRLAEQSSVGPIVIDGEFIARESQKLVAESGQCPDPIALASAAQLSTEMSIA